MSRNLLIDDCPECGHDWPGVEDLTGRPVEFRQYAEGRSGDPVTPGVPWRCPGCQTLYFMWLSYGWGPGGYPAHQDIPADASYYGPYNDEPGPEDEPRHLAAPLASGAKDGEPS